MTDIQYNLTQLLQKIPTKVSLVAVSKTKPIEDLKEAYAVGQRIFGENKVQELTEKYETLPKDIQWHMIGHLQTNKVKYITPFVSLIHSVDSYKLLNEINKQAKKNHRIVDCLLQVHIAEEEHKFGFDFQEITTLLASEECMALENVRIKGLMGMATFTTDTAIIQREFESLNTFFQQLKTQTYPTNVMLEVLSMGMSGDYEIAIAAGSNMIRVGSSIFGERNYPTSAAL